MTRAGPGGVVIRTPFETICYLVEILMDKVLNTVQIVIDIFVEPIGSLIHDALTALGINVNLSPIIPDAIETLSLFEFTLGSGITIFVAIVVVRKFVGIFK